MASGARIFFFLESAGELSVFGLVVVAFVRVLLGVGDGGLALRVVGWGSTGRGVVLRWAGGFGWFIPLGFLGVGVDVEPRGEGELVGWGCRG